MAERRTSQRDVARRVGVSVQTVSRVANGEPNVAPDKRERILTAMNEMDYRPNAAARAMRRGSFQAFGVVYYKLHSVGTHRSIEEISEHAAEAGYATTLVPLTASTGQAANGAFTRMGEMAVDALIIVLPAPFGEGETLQPPEGMPTVVFGPPVAEGVASIDFDQTVGARAAVEHLLGLGHATVHHIAGPDSDYAALEREASWRAVLAEHGAPVPAAEAGDWSPLSGYAAARRLLEAEGPAVTALFASNDQMALGAYRAVAEAGLRVPEDVSIVGFDDIDEAEVFFPPLTTVGQDWAELGRRALALTVAMLDGEPAERVSLPTRLVVRASTAPPPAR